MPIFLAIGAFVLGAIGLGVGIANSEEQKKQGLKNEYYRAESELNNLQTQYDMLLDVQLPEAYKQLESTNLYLENWEKLYESETGELQNEINTYDDYLTSWQGMYDEQVRATELQGRDNLSQLLSNWSDTEVYAADRGTGGSMALIAAQEKRKVVDFAGEDMQLGGGDGFFGLSLSNLRLGLENNKRQAEDQLSVLGTRFDLLDTSLKSDYSEALTSLGNYENTIGRLEQQALDHPEKIQDKKDLMAKLKKEGGF